MAQDAQLWNAVPRRWLYASVLVLTAFVFLPTLGFDFVYDDHWVLLGNGFLRQPGDLGLLLGETATARNVPDAFRPVSAAFDVLSYQLLGLSRPGHHALSVLLHVLVTGLLGRWLALEGAPRRLVVGTMTLFGVLAVHGEAIAVVSYREDLLAAAAGLGAMVLATRSLHAVGTARAARWVGACALMLLACGCKLSAAPLPLVWLWTRRLSPWADEAPGPNAGQPGSGPLALALPALALTTGVVVALGFRFAVLRGIDPYGTSSRIFAQGAGLSGVLAASLQIHLSYLQQLVVPMWFSPEYVDATAPWSAPATVCAALAFLGLLGVGLVAARGRRAPVVALAIVGTMLLALPTSNLAPMPNMRADRFVYLPSAIACVGLAAASLSVGDRFAERWSVPALVPWVVLVIANGSMAQGVVAAYRSDTRLWEIALRRAPGSARAHAVVGELLVARLHQRPDPSDQPMVWIRARTHCARALALDPRSDLPHLCVARLRAAERAWDASYAAFGAALDHGGVRRDRALVALASTSLDLTTLPYDERVAQAKRWLKQARAEYPYVAEVFAVSGRIRHRLGDPTGAQSDLLRASTLHPERWDVVMAGVELQLDLGHAAAAAKAWRDAQHTAALAEAPEARVQSLGRRVDAARRLNRNNF